MKAGRGGKIGNGDARTNASVYESAMSRHGRPPHKDVLTPAEWRVADAVRHGMSNARIARGQGMSRDAVKFHLSNIVGKLDLDGRDQLRRWPGRPKGGATLGSDIMTSTETFGALGQISRSVTDIAAAEAWWRDVLRVPHLYTFGDLAFFDCGGTRLMLSAEAGQKEQANVLYFAVADISASYEELSQRGIVFLGAPHMIHRHEDGAEEWMAFFSDNEGRPLAIMSQVQAG